jgi:hypothetical protein
MLMLAVIAATDTVAIAGATAIHRPKRRATMRPSVRFIGT